MRQDDDVQKNVSEAEAQESTHGVSRRNFLRGTAAAMAMAVPALAMVEANAAAPAAGAAGAATAPAAAPAAGAAAPAAPKAKALLVFRKNCTGCNSCAYACSLYHDGHVRPSTARIHVRRVKGIVDVPSICWHCADAPCVEACPITPQKAIAKDKDTNVISFTDEKLCLGAKCNKCIEACPPQYLRAHPETGLPMFCDLCGGDPECVKACARQSKETGETLRCDAQVGGVHRSFRDVTPDEAVEGLIKSLYYPNVDGDRR